VPIASDVSSPVRYFMNPGEQIRAFRDIRESGLEMLAIYHSHPSSDARPSEHDKAMALFPAAKPGEPPVPAYPGWVYVIVSLARPEQPVVRAYRLMGTEFVEVLLDIINP
jgi:proteasome lid subunit RPN8/RPN11